MFNMQFRFRAALALVWIAFLSSVDSRCLPESDQLVPTRSSAYSIKLGDNSWDSAILNDVVAKILLEEVLGYPTSRVAATGGRAQWEDIENDVFDTILEVWPTGHAANYEEFVINRDTVEYVGLLGARGRIGWYTRTQTVNEVDPYLEYWRHYKLTSTANAYNTPDVTAGKGAYYAGAADWTQFDDQIIANLGLPFEISWTYSEAVLLDKLSEANATNQPILFYFWTPHQAFAKYDLTRIFLPEYSEDCYSKAAAGGVSCDYPTAETYKIVDKRLVQNKQYDPAIFLLSKLTIKNDDQVSMLADKSFNGYTYEGAGCKWVLDNRAVWTSWIMNLSQVCADGEYLMRGECIECLQGEFLPPGTVGATACSLCPQTSYQPNRGSSSCIECPANSRAEQVGSIDIRQCVCKEDYYHPMGVNGTGMACLPCPLGATCRGGTSLPTANMGYWSPVTEALYSSSSVQVQEVNTLWAQVNGSSELWHCRVDEACVGDLVGNFCAPGYQGRMCYECQEGYFQFAGVCYPCSNLSSAYHVVVILIMITIATVWVMMNRLAALNVDAIDISLVFLQVLAVIGTYNLNWGPELQAVFSALTFVNFNVDLLSPQCLTGQYNYFQKWLLNMALPIVYIAAIGLLYAVVMGIYHLTGGKHGQLNIREVARSIRMMSSKFRASISKKGSNAKGRTSHVASGRVVPYQAEGTGTSPGEGDHDGVDLDPIKKARDEEREGEPQPKAKEAFGGNQHGTVRNLETLLRGYQHKEFTREEKMENFRGKVLSNAGSFLDIVYAMVVESVFTSFSCYKFGDSYVLSRDPNIACFSSTEHQVMMGLSILGLIVYVVGIPLTIFLILKIGHRRRLFHDTTFRGRFGWSYVRFEEEKWWWQNVWHAKRLVFVLVAVFIQNGIVQALVGLLLIVSFALAHFYARPFYLNYLDILEGVLLGDTLVLMLAGIYFSYEPHDSALSEFRDNIIIAAIALFAICSVMMVVGILMNFSHFFQLRILGVVLKRRERNYNGAAKGQAKGLLLRRLSQGRFSAEGVMLDEDKDKALEAAFAPGIKRVRALVNNRLEDQVLVFSDLFVPRVLVRWVRDSKSDFAPFRELAILTEMVSTSSYYEDRDVFEANKTFYRKLCKSLPELIDWLAFTSRADLISKFTSKGESEDYSLILDEISGKESNTLYPSVTDEELEARKKLSEGLEAVRSAWVELRVGHIKSVRKDMIFKNLLARNAEPDGFVRRPRLAARGSIGALNMSDVENMVSSLHQDANGPGEKRSVNDSGRTVGKFQGRFYRAFLPEKRQFILQMLVESYNRGEGAYTVQRFAKLVSDL